MLKKIDFIQTVCSALGNKYDIVEAVRMRERSTRYLMLDKHNNHSFALICKEIPDKRSIVADSDALLCLSHPNLPRIVNIFENSDSYIVVYNHVEGLTLEEHLSTKGVFSEEETIQIAEQVCDALDYLHTKIGGTFHSCISPSKIILQPNGNVILTDYFLRPDCDSLYVEKLNFFEGQGYFAPEQTCKFSSPDSRTEVYCLGMLLYNLTTGKHLNNFPSDTRSLRKLNAEFFPALGCVINRCTEFLPENRYQSTSDLMYALKHYLCAAKKTPSLPHFSKSFFESNKKTVIEKIKDIQFSAFAPKNIIKGEYTIIEVIMYEDSYKKIALQNKKMEEVNETTTGYFQVSDKTEISICLSSPDIEITDNTATLIWHGKYLKFLFSFYLPENYPKKQLLFDATVFFNNIIATKIKFIAKCCSKREQKMKIFRNDVMSAFISYARQDRHRVALIVQGMKKSRPDMDIFFDIDSLRSGEKWENTLMKEIENRDVLFLCWSHFAKESTWVEAEWKYALLNNGIDSIEPIPLEPPDVCPPPQELESKHFNDRELYYSFM